MSAVTNTLIIIISMVMLGTVNHCLSPPQKTNAIMAAPTKAVRTEKLKGFIRLW